ncbi:immunity 49 family protein [Streptomyces johnsoniae]|uniref:Immunity 49 family protein n=1 Tax=Streptomyces johnsoniae TaxID=3075532 RepID=A0ABU2S413_9ACTN|nr:immunity 49 family protein [Streptomyces sp. DSM 41886]MDT0443431.1 immunity 49 family protein [Streptomyces sp. DSM 41886]
MAETIRRLEQSPRMFNSALGKALMHAEANCAIDPNAELLETWEAVVTAMQVGSAMFATSNLTEGSVQCRIGHEVRTLPATGPQYYSDAGNWLTAFWLAIVCREQDRMTQLCSVPLDVLRSTEAEYDEYDEYIYHWVDALQAYWLRRPGLAEKLTKAIELSHPDIARIAGQELMNKILYQPIGLFHRFVRRDHEGFNQDLATALELHKQYWTANEERTLGVDSLVAWGPLAVACLAYDGGFPIEVESEYLPKHLLVRSWLGEFPT